MANTSRVFSTPNPNHSILCDMETELEVTLFSDLDMDLDLDLLPATPEPLRAAPATAPRLRRGPMYSAYSELRDRRLRRRLAEEEGPTAAEEDNSGDDCLPTFHATPQPKKTPLASAATTPMVCRSVPNFRAALRKENRKPAAASPMPPASKLARVWEAPVPPPVLRTPPPTLAPSRSAARRKLAVGRVPVGAAAATRSYSCLKELKGFAAATEQDGNRKGVGGFGGGVGGASARGGAVVRKSLSNMRRYV